MNTTLLDKPIVLALNSAWQVIGHRTVRQAIVALTGGDRENPPAVGLDIAYPRVDDGWDFDRPVYLNPVKWDDWIALPVRAFDFSISSATLRIRVPTVIIATQFSKMPMKQPRLCSASIYERDAGRCQYTGEFVGREGGNLDHVVPRARGGRSTFENLVWAKKHINSVKADRLPTEAGLRLIRQPSAPKKVPASTTIREARHPDWSHFIGG
jgi:5-methylcytosine-specific restriction endonuclease McrA